jgi:hypothetical protein
MVRPATKPAEHGLSCFALTLALVSDNKPTLISLEKLENHSDELTQ